MNIVITMGGLGSRFRKAGYDVPKYMIEAKGKTLFEWSMISLDGFREDAGRYVFIAMKDEKADVEAFIREKCAALGIRNFHTILIDYLTDGQATTAMLADRFWDRDAPLLIYNIDTYVESGAMNSAQVRGDGFIPCFKAEGDHWSFVRLDENGRAVEIKEKQRISDNCTLGAYYFRTCSLYEELYGEYYSGKGRLVNGEKYVAPLYNFLLEKGGEVCIADIPGDKVHVLGTPEELRAFLEE
jgi:choline kinase